MQDLLARTLGKREKSLSPETDHAQESYRRVPDWLRGAQRERPPALRFVARILWPERVVRPTNAPCSWRPSSLRPSHRSVLREPEHIGRPADSRSPSPPP